MPRGGAVFFPITHALIGWAVAHLSRPDRATRFWCLLTSVAPDLDAFGILLGRDNYERFHHVLFHNLLFGFVVTLLSARWIGWSPGALGLVFAAFVSHLVGDYFGSGPGWGISPYLPFSSFEYLNEHSWELVSWQNTTITACAIAIALTIAVTRGYTPLEFVNAMIDHAVVDALRLRIQPVSCEACAARAISRCARCRRALCAEHAASPRSIIAECSACRRSQSVAG